jgi:STE24 endopeptidase
MNPYLVFVLVALVGGYILDLVLALAGLRAQSLEIPEEFTDVLDEKQYRRNREYTRITTRFSLLQATVLLPLTLIFILAGGFNTVDLLVRSAGFGPVATGLLFIGLLLLLNFLVQLPFSLYATFVIEERFGLNRMTMRTYALDLLKGMLLALLLGGPLLAAVIWFFDHAGSLAWLYSWLVLTVFTIFIQFIAPVVLLPLFNRFTPLADGELKEAILRYARQQDFPVQGIYTMDGSRRSKRLNAFFTGLGRLRRIVLFDTLLAAMDTNETVAILAHEMGHFKKHHIPKMMLASMLQSGLMLYLLSFFLHNPGLFAAFSMEHVSTHAGLVFFAFLYAPISLVLSLFGNMLSRRYEYEADRFAVNSSGLADALISALKKLCRKNLANLTPHPLQVFVHYSHPPVLERIRAIREAAFLGRE